jgi:Family of unknown function (DUF6069)
VSTTFTSAAAPSVGSLLPAGSAAAVSTKILLMLTHVVAAAIVIPAVARRLSA